MVRPYTSISRIYLTLAVSLVVLFTIEIVFIHFPSQDDAELRELLQPNHCAMPCFLGIRPGVTKMDEAIDILNANEWVGYIEQHAVGPGTSYAHLRGWVYWDWKADAPVWFRARSPMLGVHAGAFDTVDSVVESITVATNIPFGRFWLAMGKPSDYKLAVNLVFTTKAGISSAVLRYQNAPLQNDIEMTGTTLCQAVWNAWFQPSLITVIHDTTPKEMERWVINRPLLSVARSLKSRACSGN